MNNTDINEFPIIGIGASAGGLGAFEIFFKSLPKDKKMDMAFVLIQHISPDFESLLTEIIQHYTPMEVFEVNEGMVVEQNVVYIIPPNKNMTIVNGILRLFDKADDQGLHLPIDIFFSSLAKDKKEKSICIIMSGTGRDGVLGLKEVKGEGGMVMVQNLATAEFEGMPKSAINTGLVDFICDIEEMGKELIAYTIRTDQSEKSEKESKSTKTNPDTEDILNLIKSQTGHDFTQYKPNTISRRIERRSEIIQMEGLSQYYDYLIEYPEEINRLYQELLIGVTNFFRDKSAFEYLEQQIIPKLFENKQPGSLIRIWSSGCSTGEEAYSIAILLQEYIENNNKNYKIQIFATDIDAQVIKQARKGKYPINISKDITDERIARFLILEPDEKRYKVCKTIRDMIIFSEHSMIKDPPFSKLDLITCRNVFIYFNNELQKKVIPIFHYALNSDGILFLGSSETIGSFKNLFSTLNGKNKVYQKKESLQNKTAGSLIQTIAKDIIPYQRSFKAHKDDLQLEHTLKDLLEQVILNEQGTLEVIDKEKNILYESTNQELKSSNEEMQSINEELQATNEELETSKEESQSINEELSTVNEELHNKLEELSQINNDMNNLLSGTNIATIFLDSHQNIKRFTPTANRIINLISSDIGRPMAHIVTNILKYEDLNTDIRHVLDTLETKTIQIQIKEGTWYNMIIQPYRTIEKVVEGVVITFVDITEIRLAKDKLMVTKMQYKTLFETLGKGVMLVDSNTGKILNVNSYLIQLSGYSEPQFYNQFIWEFGMFKEILCTEKNFRNFTEEKNRTYEYLTLITEQNREVGVAFRSYIYEVGNEKIIQCIIRNTEKV